MGKRKLSVPLIEKMLSDCRNMEVAKRINIAIAIFEQYSTFCDIVSLRIVGSTITSYLLRNSSDLDLQVVSDRILMPNDVADKFGRVPKTIANQFYCGDLDVIALKCTIATVPVSLQFLNPTALKKLAMPANSCLKVFRNTATNIISSEYSTSGECSIRLQQLRYSYGYLLLVPINHYAPGQFIMNMYHHMLITGINIRDLHNIKLLQSYLLRNIASTCNDQSDIFRLLGSRAQQWHEDYKEHILELSKGG